MSHKLLHLKTFVVLIPKCKYQNNASLVNVLQNVFILFHFCGWLWLNVP